MILVVALGGLSFYTHGLYAQNQELKSDKTKVVVRNKQQEKFIDNTHKALKAQVEKDKKQSQSSSSSTTNGLNVKNASYGETALAITYYALKYDRQDWHTLIDALNHNSELVITLVKSSSEITHQGQGVAYYLNTNTRSQGSCFYTIGKDNNTIYFYSGLKKQYIGSATKQEIFNYVNEHRLDNKIKFLSKYVNIYDFRNGFSH